MLLYSGPGAPLALPLGPSEAVFPALSCSWYCLGEETGLRAQEIGAHLAWVDQNEALLLPVDLTLELQEKKRTS